jgi:hypothetical protein
MEGLKERKGYRDKNRARWTRTESYFIMGASREVEDKFGAP